MLAILAAAGLFLSGGGPASSSVQLEPEPGIVDVMPGPDEEAAGDQTLVVEPSSCVTDDAATDDEASLASTVCVAGGDGIGEVDSVLVEGA
jgi:hypothetical protein